MEGSKTRDLRSYDLGLLSIVRNRSLTLIFG